MDATRYLNSVAWRTYSKDVTLLTSETESTPATYRITVSPIDVNEPGADTSKKEVGYFYKDYIGHTYSIIAKASTTIDVSDDFRCNQGPQSGFQGIVYKSVWKGRSPYLAPVYYRHLDRVAMDYSRQIELDILYSNDPNAIKVPFTNTATPSLTNYQANYAFDYGELPKIELFTRDSTNVYWSRQEKPIFSFVGGLIDSITFDLSDAYSGYITISK
jgi:hypothetical protein